MLRTVHRFIIICFLCLAGIASAEPLQFEHSELTTTQHQLIIDQKSGELAKNQLLHFKKNYEQMLSYYQQVGVTKSTLKHAEIDILSAKTSLDAIDMALTSAAEQRDRIQVSMQRAQKEKSRLELLKEEEPKLKHDIADIEHKLAMANALLQVQLQRIDVLTRTKAIVEEQMTSQEQWYQTLKELQLRQRRDQSIQASTQEMKALQGRLDQWIAKLTMLNEQIETLTQDDKAPEENILTLKLHIIEAKENVELTRLDVYLLTVQNDIRRAAESLKAHLSLSSLGAMSTLTNKTQKQVREALRLVNAKINYLELKKTEYQESTHITDVSKLMMVLTNLQEKYRQEAGRIDKMSQKLEKVEVELKQLTTQQVSQRQELPGFDWDGWMNLLSKAKQIPSIIVLYTKSAVANATNTYRALLPSTQYLVLLSVLLLSLFWYVLRYFLIQASAHLSQTRERFTVNMMYSIVELFRRSLVAWAVFGALLVAKFYTGAQVNLFLYLGLVYIIFRMLISLVRLSLMESISDSAGEDVKLYYELKWAFLFGGILSAMMVVTHQLPISYEVKALANRLFMVFVLLVGLLLFHGRHILPSILDAKVIVRRRYVYHALRILNYLVPLALISNAIIGLFGYVELALTIAKMQGVFLLVLASYLIIRGLLVDLLDYLSELVIKSLRHGWVWIEAFLKPLDKILRTAIFLLSLVALIHFWQLDQNPAFVQGLDAVLNKPLFSLGSNQITPLFMVKFIVFITVLYWASRWTREFSIRWWYARFKDLGVRNSLSIFTQYAVVIVGVLFGLQVIGVDLTGLTVVAAAFFAGLGFGLRDMANNYFSGILLLVERPFRRGDIIKIAEFEGEVVHQGMRSTTIKTWDHMEVIVPNSEIFTKSFVNWTHQDSVVRSVIAISVNRRDNPHQISALIDEVLKNHPDVLENPAPHVLMREINDGLVQMEVRYFIIIGAGRSRVLIRSEVLFAIWDCFIQHGIQPPFQRYDVALTNTLPAGERVEN